MEIDSSVVGGDKISFASRFVSPIKAFARRGVEMVREMGKLGREDPRRVIHSLKGGLALTLVSLLYYFDPTYTNFGVSAMWAIMTVVVVFEYSVGATLSKGLNRGMATVLAGVLGVIAHHLASLSGKIGEPILLGLLVFLLSASFTFVRFFPHIKARYDYGMLIFILTFALVSVSGYRDDEVLELARNRLCTVIIGGVTCFTVSIAVWPVWAGESLHDLVSLNMEKLGNFLEAFGEAYTETSGNGEVRGELDVSLKGYKSILNSMSNEESLANFAWWEPCHGRFHFRHPWRQYLKIGTLTRQCAYRIEALDGCLCNKSPATPQVWKRLKEACELVSTESAKTIKHLSNSLKTMTDSSSSLNIHRESCKAAAKSLGSLLKTTHWNDEADLPSLISVATVASLLIDIAEFLEKIAESVDELATLARFKSADSPVVVTPSKKGRTTKVSHVVIVMDNNNPRRGSIK
ncbi:hypothetical protein MLD38_008210 [Melastoma candidum]|uniref:Uncharacterized protein n=1 Tax=Melastoma candidum TaxID=119954 RepID=A0ACB9RWN3_9MYRT|nr:hypothetical protein MLD38_008210 [Melastoma candidum]